MFSSTSSAKIVVTGAAGFIGSYLAKALLKQGISPTDLCLVDDVRLFQERRCSADFLEKKIQIFSPESFLVSFSAQKIKCLFHMGACSNTEELRKDYIQKQNLHYSQQVWEKCTEHRVPLLYASSAGTYGDGSLGFSDDAGLIPQFKPLSLYAQSKQDFDLWALDQAQKSLAPPFWAGFKFFNVYGPGEDHKARQASMAFHLRKQILSLGIMKLYKDHTGRFGDGGQKRDFIYVGDLAQVLLHFAEGKNISGIYNLGTGLARSFNDLARTVAHNLGKEAKIEYFDMPESLRGQYQDFTQAELFNLRSAGYKKDFLSLEAGIKQYFSEDSLR